MTPLGLGMDARRFIDIQTVCRHMQNTGFGVQNFRQKKVEPLGASLTKYFDSHQQDWAKKQAVADG